MTSAVFARTPPPSSGSDTKTLSFWTLNRVSQAVPRAFVRDMSSGAFTNPSKRPVRNESWQILGASWTNGGEVSENTGRVYFQMGSTLYYCSASVVDDPTGDRSIILTAAHCVYDESTGTGFASMWMFVPDYDANPVAMTGSFCDTTTRGCWTSEKFIVSNSFATAGGFNSTAVKHDFAFAVVENGGKSNTQLDAEVDSQPISFSSQPNQTKSWLFGYPAARKYKGDDLIYCLGPLARDIATEEATYRVACDMTGGSSGGPWMKDLITDGPGTGTGTVFSVNSYGYNGVKAMFGPIFGSETAAMFDLAQTMTASTLYND
jgi:hypothetical protein